MKSLILVLWTLALSVVSLRGAAQTECGAISVLSNVEAGHEELTLADLLAPGACGSLQKAAAQVSLGAAPKAGIVRVLDGDRIRGMLQGLSDGTRAQQRKLPMEIPERVAVRRAAQSKSCADFGRFVDAAAPAQEQKTAHALRPAQSEIDCAAAPRIAENIPLELSKTSWNAGLQRWEFAVRCARSEDCVPFLLWLKKEKTPPTEPRGGENASLPPALSKPGRKDLRRLVQRGQTVTLMWDQSGIRMVLPVTCLDAGALGEFVWVRFKNAPGILRAEVMADGTLRVSL